MTIKYEVPFVQVKITTVDGDAIEIINGDIGGDIVSLTTTKSFSDAGTFVIQMIARDRYDEFFTNKFKERVNAYDVFRPAALIDIYINDKEVMLGIIDGMEREVNFRGKNPIRTLKISGRDMTAILLEHDIWYDDKLNNGRKYNNSLVGGVAALGVMGGESPATIMEKIVNEWLVKVVNQKLPKRQQNDPGNSFKFADDSSINDKLLAVTEKTSSYSVFQTEDVVNDDGTIEASDGDTIGTTFGPGALSLITYGNYYPIQFSMLNYSGDMLNYLKQFASFPFNELYVETGGSDIVIGHPRTHQNNGWVDSTTFYDASSNKGEGKTVNLQLNPTGNNLKRGERKIQMLEGKSYIVFRPSPYDDDEFKNTNENPDMINGVYTGMESLLMMKDLPFSIVDDSIIVEKKLQISRNNIPSFYQSVPAGGLVTVSQGKYFTPAEYDERALRRYGYRPMEVKLDAFNISSKNLKQGGMQDICTQFQKKLKSWYMNSDRYITGQMTIKGDSSIRIGTTIKYERIAGDIENEYEEGRYYVTGVTHSYVFGQRFETSLILDRGTSKKINSQG